MYRGSSKIEIVMCLPCVGLKPGNLHNLSAKDIYLFRLIRTSLDFTTFRRPWTGETMPAWCYSINASSGSLS